MMDELIVQAEKESIIEQRAALHPDLRLMELAERNPSLGGRELLREIIERGSHSAPNERSLPRDFHDALRPRNLDDSNYRTPVEQASQLHQESPALRDLYERGAVVKGDTLILPAEPHELAEERSQPFLTTLAYAQQKLPDQEQAKEFYELARAISGTTADARTELTVFKIYYDRLARDERGQRLERQDVERQQIAVARTLAEMRDLAREMAKLETRESLEVEPSVERDFEPTGSALNVAARTVDLRGEALRWPPGLSHETKERLLTRTLPELDYRLERGVPRVELFRAIDRSMTRRDANVSQEQRTEIGGFLKQYLDERLRDPETRAAHTSPAFRQAREVLAQAKTTAEVSHIAADFWRTNRQREEAQRLHQTDSIHHRLPVIKPLDQRERNLLFYGRVPEHYTAEMRELRMAYGLNKSERAERIRQLERGERHPSPPLKQLLDELAARRTVKAVSHFQASLLNERMERANEVNLFLLQERLSPHERTFLYEQAEARKQGLSRVPETKAERVAPSPTGRAFGAAPRNSNSFREYMAALGQIERQLLNEEVRKSGSGGNLSRVDLTITEARTLLPEPEQKEVRLRASQLAWEALVPQEVFERQSSKEASRIGETIATLQEQLQERARVAQAARDALTATEARPLQRSAPEVVRPPVESQRFAAFEAYVVQTREAVYRAFELLDEQRAEFVLRQDGADNVTKERAGNDTSQPEWGYDSLREALSARFGNKEGFAQGPQAVAHETSQAIQFER